MKLQYNNKTEEHNIVERTINSATLIRATLNNAISNNETLSQCNIK